MRGSAICLATVLLLVAATAAGAGKPLSKDEVIQLLTTGVESRVVALVHEYGVDFGVDDAAERDVRAAGGGDKLIAAIREEAAKEAKKRLGLGDTFLQAGDLDGAAAQYSQALRFDPKNAGAHVGMGKVLERRGDTDAALAQYQEAIKAKPDSGAAYNALGAFWEKKGEQKKALETYRSGLEAEPENAEVKANYLRLTAEAAKCPDYDSCLKASIGALWARRWDETLSYAEALTRLAPGRGEAWTLIGWVYFEKGDYERAFAMLDKGLSLGAGVSTTVCRDRFGGCERGTFTLGNKDLSFSNTRNERIFSAPLSEVTSKPAALYYKGTAAYAMLTVAGKNYRLYLIPSAVECQIDLAVICPEPGFTQQKVFANYVHHAIQRVSSGH